MRNKNAVINVRMSSKFGGYVTITRKDNFPRIYMYITPPSLRRLERALTNKNGQVSFVIPPDGYVGFAIEYLFE